MNVIRARDVVLAALVATGGCAVAVAQGEPIWVSNFPEVQTVTGSVKVAEAIPSNEIVRFTDTTVTTVQRHQTTRLVPGGTIEAGPFTTVALSLAGFVEGTPAETATLGVILVPDEDFVLDALKEGIYLFPVEVTVNIVKDSLPYVGTAPELHQLAFPRYRVYFYNSGQRTVKTKLFAFLMN